MVCVRENREEEEGEGEGEGGGEEIGRNTAVETHTYPYTVKIYCEAQTIPGNEFVLYYYSLNTQYLIMK